MLLVSWWDDDHTVGLWRLVLNYRLHVAAGASPTDYHLSLAT